MVRAVVYLPISASCVTLGPLYHLNGFVTSSGAYSSTRKTPASRHPAELREGCDMSVTFEFLHAAGPTSSRWNSFINRYPGRTVRSRTLRAAPFRPSVFLQRDAFGERHCALLDSVSFGKGGRSHSDLGSRVSCRCNSTPRLIMGVTIEARRISFAFHTSRLPTTAT